ncbi:MAG: LLM class flavin-dependent oxidoreductase [Candidatus Thorarchaeota archaeon]
MNIGVQIEPQFGFSYDDVKSIAVAALDSGFSTLWFSDHFMLNETATDKILLDPWLMMTALVREVDDIRVGGLVFCNSYRQPALHAKMGATLDVLSNGRLEFGIGAGWKEIEYKAYGYRFPSAKTRIEQLAEAIQIIRGAWTNEHFSFHGKHYFVEKLISFPKPVQKPHPTIWVGTMRARSKMLNLAAQWSDGLNIAWSFSIDDCKHIFADLDRRIKKYGRRPHDVKRSVGFWTRVFHTESEMEQQIIEGAKQRGIPIEDYRKRLKSSLWGTVDEVVERLRDYEALGISHAILMLPHGHEIEQVKLIGNSM